MSVHGQRLAALMLALALPGGSAACINLLGDLEPTGGGTGGAGGTTHASSGTRTGTGTGASTSTSTGTGGPGPCVDPGWGPGDVAKCGGLLPTQDQICKVDSSAGCDARCTPEALVAQCGIQCTHEAVNTPPPSCATDCTNDCFTACGAGGFDCLANCNQGCATECDTECTGAPDVPGCTATCKAACGGECNRACLPAVGSSDCSTVCPASCDGQCQYQANAVVETMCVPGCTTDAELSGVCAFNCKNGGALFCDDQYVDATTLKECVDYLGTIRVDADGKHLGCAEYCAAVMGNCTPDNGGKQFPGLEHVTDPLLGCLKTCQRYPVGKYCDTSGNTLGCRMPHALAAATTPLADCSPAGPSGRTGCGDECESLCDIAYPECSPFAGWTSRDDCLTACAAWPVTPGPYVAVHLYTDSFDCRLEHATGAVAATLHCAHMMAFCTTPL
jgi:hypothetical protein